MQRAMSFSALSSAVRPSLPKFAALARAGGEALILLASAGALVAGALLLR